MLEGIFPRDNIEIISSRPFSATLRNSLVHGLATGRDWTFCVDADVLVHESGIRELFRRAASAGDDYFEFHGFVADKFFGDFRPAGNHLYKTAHLQRALALIPEEGVSLRPETFMLKAMQDQGIEHKYYPDLIVGIHDYEQYYSDIFAKGYLHSRKHVAHLSRLLPNWWKRAETDDDFKVLLWGIGIGISHGGNVFADKSKVPFEIFEYLFDGREEKPPLNAAELSGDYIDKILKKTPRKIQSQGRSLFRKLWRWMR